MTKTPRAIKFTVENFPTIAQESGLKEWEVDEMYVEHEDANYYFVVDLPSENGMLPWALVPDFTLEKHFRFVGIESDTTFNRILKK